MLAEMIVAGAQLCDIMDRLDPYPFDSILRDQGSVARERELLKVSNMLSMRLTRWRQKGNMIIPGGAVRKHEPKKTKAQHLHNVTDIELSTLSSLSDEQMLVGVRYPYNSNTGRCVQAPAPKGRHEGEDALDPEGGNYQGVALVAPLPADLPDRWKAIYDAAGRPFPTLDDYIDSTGVFSGLPKPRYPFPQALTTPGRLNSENPAIPFQHQRTVNRIPPAASISGPSQTGAQIPQAAHTQSATFPTFHHGWSVTKDYIRATNAAAYAPSKRKRGNDEDATESDGVGPRKKRALTVKVVRTGRNSSEGGRTQTKQRRGTLRVRSRLTGTLGQLTAIQQAEEREDIESFEGDSSGGTARALTEDARSEEEVGAIGKAGSLAWASFAGTIASSSRASAQQVSRRCS